MELHFGKNGLEIVISEYKATLLYYCKKIQLRVILVGRFHNEVKAITAATDTKFNFNTIYEAKFWY